MSTLTKTIAGEQTSSMNKTHNLAAAAKFGLDDYPSLIFIHGCQIKFCLSSTFDFLSRLPNFNSCIIHVWFSSTVAKFEIISHPRFQISHRVIGSTTLGNLISDINIWTSPVTIPNIAFVIFKIFYFSSKPSRSCFLHKPSHIRWWLASIDSCL